MAETSTEKTDLKKRRIFRDRTNPLDVYDDVEMLTKFCFRPTDILEITQELKGHIQHPNRTGALPPILQLGLVFSPRFAFFSTETLGPICNTSKQLSAL